MQSEIDRLRNAARRLKKAYRAADDEALTRVAAYISDASVKHADFLHVIACENGFDSWPKLKFQLETQALSRAEKAEKLQYALFVGQQWRVTQLLEETPDLASENLALRVATYDLNGVTAAIAARPAAATDKIGTRTPILHLAFSKYHKMAPEKRADMMAIAALLVANGADVNDGYPAEIGAPHLLSALYGALGHADNVPLAEWLLDQGATPDDSESLYHATELGHHDGLKLLARHKANPYGTNALLRAIDFNDPGMVRILLEMGADPDEAAADHPSGQPVPKMPALHHAARRWAGAEVAAVLLEHGADASRSFDGHTAYAVARMHGNTAMAAYLSAQGHASPLSPIAAAVAASAEGTPVPRLDPDALVREDREILNRLSSHPDHLPQIRALVTAGLDPHRADRMKMTPLHQAAWCGFRDYVAYFLTLSPDLGAKNAYGGDVLSTTLHGAENCPERAQQDHFACVQMLLEAGAPVDQRYVEATGDERLAGLLADWLEGATS